ncbi:MAG: hypothetical protein JNK82_09740 [Myxococcaceae bacterium]|nr:hypothetical protein [Myxococcaceae bacterium]
MTGLHRIHQTDKLWRCPVCRRPFSSKPATHACGKWTVADHFAGKPRAWVVYEALLDAARDCGPVKQVADEKHVEFHGRHVLVLVEPHSGWLTGHVVLGGSKKHTFELHAPDEIDEALRAALQQAYAR